MSDIGEVNDWLSDYDPDEHQRHITWHLRMEEFMFNTTEPTDFNALRKLATEGHETGHLDLTAHRRAHEEISKAARYVDSLKRQIVELVAEKSEAERALGDANGTLVELKRADDTDKVEPEKAEGPSVDWQQREDRITAMHLAKGDVDRARKIVAFIEEG